MLKSCALWVNRLLWATVISVLLLLAAYVSLGRYYIGYVEQYQQQLVAQITRLTDLPLSIDRLYGRWSKLAPVLTLENLSVYSSEGGPETVLSIDNISFKIDILGSLIKRSVQVQHLYIDGVKCRLLETSQGRWQLAGYPTKVSGGPDVDKLLDVLLSVRGAELLAAELALQFANGTESLLSIQQLSLNHRDGFRRLKVEASVDESEQPLSAVLESHGDPRNQSSFSARAYLKLDDVDFSTHLPALAAFGVDINDARVDGELWLDWQPDTLVTVQGNLSVPLLDIAALSGEPLQDLREVAFSFRAEKTSSHDWQAWVPDMSAQWQGQSLHVQQLQLHVGKDYLGFTLPVLDLALLSRHLLAFEQVTEPLKEVISTLAVSGQLNNVRFNLFSKPAEQLPDEGVSPVSPPRFLLQANLDNVSLSAWRGAPGATGVSGYLEVRPKQGTVELDSEAFSMAFPQVYSEPMQFDSAKGRVAWQLTEDRVLVDSSPLFLTADHGPATALLDLNLPLQAGSERPPEMILTVGLENTEASYRNKFIPFILDEKFLDWMAGSVPAGWVNHGGFIYRGSLRKGDGDNRTVQLYFDIADTTLDYHPEWPKLTNISGLVEIADTDVVVATHKANIFDLTVPAARVTVAPEPSGGMWLSVEASARGGADDALRIINESAVRKLVGDVFSDWQLQGHAEAAVSLGVPIAGADKALAVAVDVQLAKADLTIPDYRLDFTGLGGELHYGSESGISSKALSAQLYDRPVQVTVSQADNKNVLVEMEGRVDMADVAAWARQPALVFAKGDTDFSAQIKVAGKDNSAFTVQSDLLGITLDLPAPYGKQPERAQPFWLHMPIAQPRPMMRMALTDMAELQLQFENNEVQSGLVVLGDATNREHELNQLLVTGRVANFDLAQWQPVLARYQQRDRELQEQTSIAEDSASVSVEPDKRPAMSVKVRDLQLARFIGFDQQFTGSTVTLQRESDGWLLLAQNERLEGEFLLPDDGGQSIRAAFKRLQLPADFSQQALAADDKQPFKDFKLDFTVDKLLVGDEDYGNLAFQLSSRPEAMRFDNIHGQLRGIIIDENNPLTLEWFRQAQGDQSRLFGAFRVGDIGRVLERWNYERIIASKKGNASIDLSWPGSPDQWQLQASAGPMYLELNNGRFLKASDTASGTLKVVGIVNLMNIARRLQLDFSDLYKSGISFDKIQGELVVGDGQLKIVDDLKVKSPSSSFYLRGNADLLAKELDMDLIATLPLANNLPWIVALAGGLPTAAGVYVASKIFEDQMDSFSSAVYQVKGDWNNPDLQLKRVFDDGKKSKSATVKIPTVEEDTSNHTNPQSADEESP